MIVSSKDLTFELFQRARRNRRRRVGT